MTETGGAGAAAGPDSYEAAVEPHEENINRHESVKAELPSTLALCREGKTLVEYCKGELDAVSGELQRLDLDDLVRKLEAGEGAADSDAGADSDGGEGAADSDAVPS